MFCINNTCWRLQFVPSDSSELQRHDGSYSVGCTNEDTHTVYISNQIDGEFLHKVITHEVCHCLIYSVGIQMDIWQEEILADFLAKYAKDILRIADDLYAQYR